MPTVVTFHPHPRRVLGYGVELLTTLERRLELLAELGDRGDARGRVLARVPAHRAGGVRPATTWRRSARAWSSPARTSASATGASGDLDLLARLGFDVRSVPLLEGVSSSEIRRLLHEGEVDAAPPGCSAARPRSRGSSSRATRAAGTLGFPTANLAVEPDLLVPRRGIYAGYAAGHRAAISIGTNPHYGGDELRVEAFLLGFAGDLYGKRLVVELWRRLRDERAFASEQDLIDQIARDVEETERAERPLDARMP